MVNTRIILKSIEDAIGKLIDDKGKHIIKIIKLWLIKE